MSWIGERAGIEATILWEDAFAVFSGSECSVCVTVCGLRVDLVRTIHELLCELIELPRRQGAVYAVTSGSMGLELTHIGVGGLPLERGNYSQEVLAAYDHIGADLGRAEPTGRLAILRGPPGSGKTYLIRGLLNDVAPATFVLIPPSMVARLSGPELLPLILNQVQGDDQEGPLVFVIEDADECLVLRESDNMSSIASILNISDGLLGQILDLRVVASTNAARAGTSGWALDKALLRPGRLSAEIEVGMLERSQATRIYTRLVRWNSASQPGLQEMTLAEVYAKARMDGLNTRSATTTDEPSRSLPSTEPAVAAEPVPGRQGDEAARCSSAGAEVGS